SAVLQRIVDDVCLAKHDSVPMIRYADVEIRRFQDKLYFMPRLPEHDASQIIEFSSTTDLRMNDQITLSWQQTDGLGLNEKLITSGLTVRFRQGGEQIHLPKHLYHKSLKHLFQEWGIPPWQRDRIPLIFKGEQLIAVVDYAVAIESDASGDGRHYLPSISTA
ncbi:MAG: tRNA(Ile)-lysidine synthetase, partial [Methylophaga sp.]